MDGVPELPCPYKGCSGRNTRRLVRIRRPDTQDREALMVQQAGQLYLTAQQLTQNDFCSRVDCLYCHQLRMQKLVKPPPWPRGKALVPRHTHHSAPFLPIIKQGRCLIKRRHLKTPRSRRKATVIHLPPLTGQNIALHRTGSGFPWWAAQSSRLGGISWVNADVTEPSTRSAGHQRINVSVDINGDVLHLEEIRLDEPRGEEGHGEGEDQLGQLASKDVLPDISDKSSVRSADTAVSKDTGIGTATAFSEEVTLPSVKVKYKSPKEQCDDVADKASTEGTDSSADGKEGTEDDPHRDALDGVTEKTLEEDFTEENVVEMEKDTSLDEPPVIDTSDQPSPNGVVDEDIICEKEGCSCPYHKTSSEKQSPQRLVTPGSDFYLPDIFWTPDNEDKLSTSSKQNDDREKHDFSDSEESDLHREENDLDRGEFSDGELEADLDRGESSSDGSLDAAEVNHEDNTDRVTGQDEGDSLI